MTRFVSTAQLTLGALLVRRSAAILSMVASRALLVTSFAPNEQLTSRASPVRRFAATY